MSTEWNDNKNTDTNSPQQPRSLEPVKASDKKVINGTSDINQLAPFKYPWAWNYFLNANKNHWSPTDIDLQQDVDDYNNKLNPAEKQVLTNTISYLTTSDIQAMRNIGLAVMEKMTAPELQIYQARQMYEKSLHTWAYQNFIEQMGINENIYNRYRIVPEIMQKVEANKINLQSIITPDIDLNNPQRLNQFMISHAFFTSVFEGCWVHNAFVPLFVLQNRNLMQGLGKLCQYIFRDLDMHIKFGTQVLRSIQEETGHQWQIQDVEMLWKQSFELENHYIKRLSIEKIDGIKAEEWLMHHKYIANTRAQAIGMDSPYPTTDTPYHWLAKKIITSHDDQNHTASSVQSSGALSWD